MDAISFVFGVRSTQLRASQLRELIYRQENQSEEEVKDSAHVELIFTKTSGASITFRRSITPSGAVITSRSPFSPLSPFFLDLLFLLFIVTFLIGFSLLFFYLSSLSALCCLLCPGASEYVVNDRVLSAAGYVKELEKLGVLVNARNFLVFQGDVESIARKSPKDLSVLVECLKHDNLWGSFRFLRSGRENMRYVVCVCSLFRHHPNRTKRSCCPFSNSSPYPTAHPNRPPMSPLQFIHPPLSLTPASISLSLSLTPASIARSLSPWVGWGGGGGQIDELSGSLRLREEYERRRAAQQAAEEELVRTFERKKSVTKERKQLREQKEESDRYQTLQNELVL